MTIVRAGGGVRAEDHRPLLDRGVCPGIAGADDPQAPV